MQSKAATVADYLASLPEDRRKEIEKVRAVILKNLDKDFREGMSYGMIGYAVPHSIFPAGYHCDPKQPLPYAGLASQKNHMSIYMMGLYIGATDEKPSELLSWFKDAWAKTGKKLDMGKACIRFKKADDLALDVLGEAFKRLPAKKYIETYLQVLNSPRSTTKKSVPKKTTTKNAPTQKTKTTKR
jgi:uncharacterized protein YdhG (YjbR/CyaY superfamily)